MRRKTRQEIADITGDVLTVVIEKRLNAVALRLHQRINEADEAAILAIEKIQPAHVDMTQELADQITAKLRGPLTIPAEMVEWVREEARYHDMQQIYRLGFGREAADMHWTLRTDGTIMLEFRRPDGMRWWVGVFGPPELSDGGLRKGPTVPQPEQ